MRWYNNSGIYLRYFQWIRWNGGCRMDENEKCIILKHLSAPERLGEISFINNKFDE